MDPRLIQHYKRELDHLKEMGKEFAIQFPKIAGRLNMSDQDVKDPYVERLLEGFAFLAARIQLKLDAEFPQFAQRLVEILYPNFLAPLPAMLIARLEPKAGDAALVTGAVIPRGSALHFPAAGGGSTECRFRTAHEVRLWPIEITGADYFSHASNLPLEQKPEWKRFGAGVRISIRLCDGLDFSRIALEDLRIHCAGSDEVAYRLHELICGSALGIFVSGKATSGGQFETLDADAIEPVGFDEEHALLPVTLRGFEGYRLLQEFFAFPQRFLFFDLRGIGDSLRRLGGQEVDITILFARGDPSLMRLVDQSCFALHCVPAVNLFEHRCDRIHITRETQELHVVPDRVRPMDFEIHTITSVTGYGVGMDSERRFMPLYAAFHTQDQQQDAYFAVKREPRIQSSTQRRDGLRSSYIGTEVYLSLVDPREAPFADDLQQVAVTALCSNRDLPVLVPRSSSGNDLQLQHSAPVDSIRVIKGPSRPMPANGQASSAWLLINQMTLNHVTLLDTDNLQGAVGLRQLLRLYAHDGDATHQRLVDGLRSIGQRQIVRRLPMQGPIAFGRGVQLELTVDELAFQGSSAFLLGCVMERFFARYVSLNSFTETSVRSLTRGVILTGRPRCGARLVL
jgi:type VI secretion system protein ImpG